MDRIPKSIQIIIEDYIAKLSEIITIDKVIIFGSYAKGNTHEYSDVDLAIFSDYFKDNEPCRWNILPIIKCNGL